VSDSTMTSSGVRFAVCAILAVTTSPAQSGARFEVASIKPSADFQTSQRSGHLGIKLDPARVDIGFWSLRQLIYRAYGIWGYQLTGPDWMGTERFDVVATFPAGAGENQLPEMLQHLLADRFGLKAHTETKDLPGFALRVAKGGPKMKLTEPADQEPGLTSTARIGRLIDDLSSYDGSPFGLTNMSRAGGNIRVEFTRMPVAALVQILASYLAAPVVDLTGLTGKYQGMLEFSVSATLSSPSSGDAPDPSGTSLFSTVPKLGLKLERHKAPVEVRIVDHLDRAPSAN